MTAIILDGKALSDSLKTGIAAKVAESFLHVAKPKLAVILVGENPASLSYVKIKEKTATKLGFSVEIRHFKANVEMPELLAAIDEFNRDPLCDACFVQLPVPAHLDTSLILQHISSQKDADGLTPTSLGRLLSGEDGGFLPCTPRGILRLLDHYKIDFLGKEAVVVGRSLIVGKPMAVLLQQRHCTVTACHTKTKDLRAHVERAEILVVAAGSPELIRGEWIREGAVVVDAGFTKTRDGKILGDVEYESALKRASYITPVPGGVGPMTVISLMEQCLESALRRI